MPINIDFIYSFCFFRLPAGRDSRFRRALIRTRFAQCLTIYDFEDRALDEEGSFWLSRSRLNSIRPKSSALPAQWVV